MRDVTLCLAYFDNPSMLHRQLMSVHALPQDLWRHVKVVIVDDGSPNHPAALPAYEGKQQVRLFRVGVNVRWNQDAARNIAAHEAETDWLLLTDIDHLVPEATWNALIRGRLDPAEVYRFQRCSEPDLAPYKPHPNSWAMTKTTYGRIGGYDERFAGWYGTDADFAERAAQRSSGVVLLKEKLIRVPREVTPDASTPPEVWGRKTDEDKANIRRIKLERAAIPGWKPVTLSFPYERVA